MLEIRNNYPIIQPFIISPTPYGALLYRPYGDASILNQRPNVFSEVFAFVLKSLFGFSFDQKLKKASQHVDDASVVLARYLNTTR